MLREGWKPADLFRDILDKLFQNRAGGELTIARIKGDENEIMLRVGQAEKPFGLINVGDASGLANHVVEQGFDNVAVLEVRVRRDHVRPDQSVQFAGQRSHRFQAIRRRLGLLAGKHAGPHARRKERRRAE